MPKGTVVFVSVRLPRLLAMYKTKDVLDVFKLYASDTLAIPRNGNEVVITDAIDKVLVPAIAEDLISIGVNFHVHGV